MEPELNEGKTRRGRKQQSNVSDKYLLLTPVINRCKLHLMTAKTLAAGKLQTMSDSQDLSKETKISTTQTTGDSNSANPFVSCFMSSEQSGLHPNNKTGVASDNCAQYLVQLAGAAPVSHASNEARGRSSRVPNSAEVTCHRLALKSFKLAGYNRRAPSGFPCTEINFAASFQRIDLDRYYSL
ncbi:hypothetical protein XENOCAPTIV_025691 [Xenoophorus captivus]|uniref:Uncharacterized protein n=1 Tax=Xenoophorus captivus TaxID=1517983 RepID=A0ABV0QK38_9TELE